MVKKLLLVLGAFLSAPAISQSFPQPTDVPAFNQVVPSFKTDGTLNVVLDSTVTPMPVGSGLPNIPIPSTTNRIVTVADQTESRITASISGTAMSMTGLTSGPAPRVGDTIAGTGVNSSTTITAAPTPWSGTSGSYTVSVSQTVAAEAMVSTNSSAYCLSTINGGPAGCPENKFRTISGVTTLAPDDPQRNFGQPGQSHPHQFFAGNSCNAYTTYKSIRAHSLGSAAAGTDVNSTCYWFPAVEVLNPYGDGKNFAIKPDSVTVS